MHLTKRFFAINALSVLVSIAFTALAVVISIAVYTKLFGTAMDGDNWRRTFEARTEIGEIRRAASAMEFEQLLEPSFQQQLASRLDVTGAEAVILKNREIVFSTRPFDQIDIDKSLLLTSGTADTETLELGGWTYLAARADYPLGAGRLGVLLLLAPIQVNNVPYGFFILFAAVCFLGSFLAMNAWVSYRFSRGIILPVMRLKDAAVKISEGDVSGGIPEEGDGEVRELCRTLELMRMKLKESIYLQQKYDENRKFLISSISHDLKTPVSSIIGYIDGIIDGVAQTPEKQTKYLETAKTKAVQVNAMIDDLLLYSKLDLNQVPYHFEKTDLESYFGDCVNDQRYEFDKAKVKLTLSSELNHRVFVSLDRERMKRVIQNILENAKKYMEKADGQVDILLRETRTSVIIEIRDNGKGIPEDDLPHVFERFYRADRSRNSSDGSGLGLAIAKQIVEDHGGNIWARSAAGEGTRIIISLKKV